MLTGTPKKIVKISVSATQAAVLADPNALQAERLAAMDSLGLAALLGRSMPLQEERARLVSEAGLNSDAPLQGPQPCIVALSKPVALCQCLLHSHIRL